MCKLPLKRVYKIINNNEIMKDFLQCLNWFKQIITDRKILSVKTRLKGRLEIVTTRKEFGTFMTHVQAKTSDTKCMRKFKQKIETPRIVYWLLQDPMLVQFGTQSIRKYQ